MAEGKQEAEAAHLAFQAVKREAASERLAQGEIRSRAERLARQMHELLDGIFAALAPETPPHARSAAAALRLVKAAKQHSV